MNHLDLGDFVFFLLGGVLKGGISLHLNSFLRVSANATRRMRPGGCKYLFQTVD